MICHIYSQVQGEGCFTHTRTRAHNHHLSRPQTLQPLIDGGIVGIHALWFSIFLHIREIVIQILHDVGKRGEFVFHLFVCDVEQHVFCRIDDLFGVLRRVKCELLDVGRRVNDGAQHGVALENLDVMFPRSQRKGVVA